MAVFHASILVSIFCTSLAAPQQPEINDQYKITEQESEKAVTAQTVQEKQPNQTLPELKNVPTAPTSTETLLETEDKDTNTGVAVPQISFTLKVYKFFSDPIYKVVNAPKVNEVLRNIGTCVVNGAMELFSYYLPAPLMPLLASAAGLVIPFEPVVMLKERMPVTSYRRAFQTAMNTFLRTFDKYKVADEFDPYMTRRFNRRFMNDNRGKKEGEKPQEVEIE
ncbi:hypothetical protein PYW07_010845 [Mythimna separata]|uniref:Uncharacterized protein n=1 Tax=Mythimna separata TaxID=271217 RepID=A0AAD8DL88_MYTSE|nr:hypothetical protein PYW07_010845 [Mythimna separata]